MYLYFTMIMSPSLTVFLFQYNFLFSIFLGVVCPASAVDHARLPAAHCRHSHAEVPRQCEADMRRLENWKHEDLAYQGYTYSLESNQSIVCLDIM